jgi:hypothetical protein
MEHIVNYYITRYVQDYMSKKYKWLIYSQVGLICISIISLVLAIWEVPYTTKIGISSSLMSLFLFFVYKIIQVSLENRVKDILNKISKW